MSVAKIKKHFSLFMVKKSIKKETKHNNSKDNRFGESQNPVEKYVIESVPKFIDPWQYFHLRGDILFIDKPYENEIGLVSPRNGVRTVDNLIFHTALNLFSANFVNKNFNFDSWTIIYKRLMTLGDQNAFKLASTIEQVLIPQEQESLRVKPNYVLPIESSPHYMDYCKEVEKLLAEKKDSYYLILQYEIKSEERGMVMTKMGFSKSFVELIWGEESIFLEFLMNYEMFDFISIERERYFEFVTHNIEVVTSHSEKITFRLKSIEGTYTSISPSGKKIKCFDKNGNLLGFVFFYDFSSIGKEFVKRVAEAREKKTIISKRKPLRENNLEKFLNLYYSIEDFCKKNSVKTVEAKKENCLLQLPGKQISNMKTCGFRSLGENENNGVELLLS